MIRDDILVPVIPDRIVMVRHVSRESEKKKCTVETEPALIISSGSNCKRSTAPGRPKRRSKKRSKPSTQDMIIEGTYYTDSEPETDEEGFLVCGVTGDIIDLV